MANVQDRTQKDLIKKIEDALGQISFGSIEIHVQDKVATQITVRNIEKTSIEINNSSKVQTSEEIVETSQKQIDQNGQSFFAVHTHIRRRTD